MLWKNKIESAQTAEFLRALERKEPTVAFEEIREESEENEQGSPLPSGSNTDRIFSEPTTEDLKKHPKSAFFPGNQSRVELGQVARDNQDLGLDPVDYENIDDGPGDDAEGEEGDPVKNRFRNSKRPESPVILHPKRSSKRSLSKDSGKISNRKQSFDESDAHRSRTSSSALKFSSNNKVPKRSTKALEMSSDHQLAGKLANLRDSIDPVQAKPIEFESLDRPKSKPNLGAARVPANGDRYWRQMLRSDGPKPGSTVDPTRSHVVSSQDKLPRLRLIKRGINTSKAELGKTIEESHGPTNCHPSGGVDQHKEREKRHLAYGRPSLSNLPPFLRLKMKAASIIQSRQEEAEPPKRASRQHTFDAKGSSAFDRRMTFM